MKLGNKPRYKLKRRMLSKTVSYRDIIVNKAKFTGQYGEWDLYYYDNDTSQLFAVKSDDLISFAYPAGNECGAAWLSDLCAECFLRAFRAGYITMSGDLFEIGNRS
jgi:hypothetical protein